MTDASLWMRADGYGIRMGDGLYALDLDSYKEGCAGEEWMRFYGASFDTRVHETRTGGRHYLYKLPPRFRDLRTRANIVPGLDSRGAGGYIAFGEGYKVLDPSRMRYLSSIACSTLAEGGENDVVVGVYKPPKDSAAQRELDDVIEFGEPLLTKRWKWGMTDGLKDSSASAMDMSVARLLARMGLREQTICWALLNRFRWGTASRDGVSQKTIRSALRCASRAVQGIPKETTDDE